MTKKRILKVLFLYLFLKHSRGRDVFGCWQWAIWSQKKYFRYVRPKKTNQKVRCLEMIRFTSSLRSPVNEKGALNLIYGKVENIRYIVLNIKQTFCVVQNHLINHSFYFTVVIVEFLKLKEIRNVLQYILEFKWSENTQISSLF